MANITLNDLDEETDINVTTYFHIRNSSAHRDKKIKWVNIVEVLLSFFKSNIIEIKKLIVDDITSTDGQDILTGKYGTISTGTGGNTSTGDVYWGTFYATENPVSGTLEIPYKGDSTAFVPPKGVYIFDTGITIYHSYIGSLDVSSRQIIFCDGVDIKIARTLSSGSSTVSYMKF